MEGDIFYVSFFRNFALDIYYITIFKNYFQLSVYSNAQFFEKSSISPQNLLL